MSKLYKGKPAVKRRIIKKTQAMWRRGLVGWKMTLDCGHVVVRSHSCGKYDHALCEECGAIEKPEET